jgi:hypothetical protein
LRCQAAQKRGDVPRNRRIVRIGQAEFHDRTSRSSWPRIRGNAREKTVDDDLLDFLARDFGRPRTADQLRPGAQQRNRR